MCFLDGFPGAIDSVRARDILRTLFPGAPNAA